MNASPPHRADLLAGVSPGDAAATQRSCAPALQVSGLRVVIGTGAGAVDAGLAAVSRPPTAALAADRRTRAGG
jgi:hypothetical protein